VDVHIQALPGEGQSAFLVAVRDLSDRVRRLGERWQKTVDEMDEGVALLDPDGRPLQANRAFAGLAPAVLEEARSRAGASERTEWTMVVGERTLRCVVAPLSRAGETVVVVRDETDWLRAEARLRENQKMEAVATLAGGVAHDFNNLLAGILLHLRLIDKDPGATGEAVATIRSLAEDGAEVVRGMLDFARPEEGPRAPLDLVTVVREQEAMLHHMLPSRTALELATCSGPARILASAGGVRRILLNLVLNARDAIGDRGGTIRVRVGRDADAVELEVCDDGPGVPVAQRGRIFEPFFSRRRDGRGAGLGLAVTYAIVQEHDADIVCRPGPDGGASFLVSFPALEGTPPGEDA
jgi:signal transduction histidine kinase